MNTDALADEELEQIRLARYWIQDTILERDRRIRKARHDYINGRRPHDASWFWAQFKRALSSAQSWIVVSLVGVCIGLNAAIISIVTEWLSDIKMGYCSDGWWLNQQFCCWEIEEEETDACESWHPWSTVTPARWLIYVIFAAMFSFTAAHLVRSLAKYAAGSGISEIKCILAGFIMQGFLGFATLFIKSITLPLVIASGLSVGKEGPSVHVACCIGYTVAGLFKTFSRSEGKMREITTAASAAGVAVAFGSPLEMSHTFSIRTMWRSFFCALMATVTLSAMNPFRTGKLVLFQVTYDRDWHFFEIIFFVILGIFGGLYGAFVVKFNLQVAAFRRKHLANYGVAEAVTLAVITAIIGYPNRFLRIDMTESMAVLFRECEGDVDNICKTATQWRIANSLILATLIRTGLVIISYGCKVPAGIFVPSMAIGATFGRTVGIMVRAMYRAYPKSGIFAFCDPNVPCITPGTYAFLGAAAALSGVMRITVTVVVIMFELTGALTYILPTMIVLLVTKAVGDLLGTNGIADEMIRFNGFPFLEKEDHAYNVSVSAVMRNELHVLTESGMRVKDIDVVLAASDVKGFPIVSADGFRTLIGYIGRTELLFVLERFRKVRDVDSETPCHFTSGEGDREHLNMPTGAVGIEEEFNETIFESASTDGGLKFWPWVNQVRSPRVILVEDHGMLTGLVTVKDVLRFIATEKPDHGPSFDERGGLDGILEEVWTWTMGVVHRVVAWSQRFGR
ncbi:chloride channel [Mucidula mucida]|nr:chloride channel [Mucidula mucida]